MTSSQLRLITSKRIREIRLSRGITQAQLAEASNLTPQYICLIESQKKSVSLSALLAISNALDVSLDELLYGLQLATDDIDYLADFNEVIKDCDPFERRVLYEALVSIKHSIRTNVSLIEPSDQ